MKAETVPCVILMLCKKDLYTCLSNLSKLAEPIHFCRRPNIHATTERATLGSVPDLVVSFGIIFRLRNISV